MPSVASGLLAAGRLPPLVRSVIGTCSAIVLTLKPDTSSETKLAFARSCGVDSTAGHAGRAGAGNLAEVQRVEGGAQVDVELVVGRAGEHLDAPVELKDRLLEQLLVVGRRPRPDIARQRDQLLAVGRPPASCAGRS